MSRLRLAISVVFAASVLVRSQQCGDAGNWCSDKECCGNDSDGVRCLDSCVGQSCSFDSECGIIGCCGDDGICKDPFACDRCTSDDDCFHGCCSNGKCHQKEDILADCPTWPTVKLPWLYPCSVDNDCKSNCCRDETCQISSLKCENTPRTPSTENAYTIKPYEPSCISSECDSGCCFLGVCQTTSSLCGGSNDYDGGNDGGDNGVNDGGDDGGDDGGNDGGDDGGDSSGGTIVIWVFAIIFAVLFKLFLFARCYFVRFRSRSVTVVRVLRPATTSLNSHVVDTVPIVDEDHLQQEYERQDLEEESTPLPTEANNSPCEPPPVYSANNSPSEPPPEYSANNSPSEPPPEYSANNSPSEPPPVYSSA